MKMINVMMRFVLLMLLLGAVPVLAQTTDKSDPSPIKFPTPKGIKNQLFYLQRDPNTNTIICELNADEYGKVNEKDPILVYWLRYADEGQKEQLNYIQRKFAYGIQAKKLAKDSYELRFVSHKKLPMYLKISDTDKKFHVYATVNNKQLQIERIFLRIVGGSFWLPNVHYVEIRGIHTESGNQVTERIKV